MVVDILLLWFALAVAFAAGYVLRALMEGVDTGDIDDRLKDYSDDYKPAEAPVEAEKPHSLNVPILTLALLPLMFLMTSCLPKVETVTVTERSCELAPLEEKPRLQSVEYVDVNGMLCLDAENQAAALEREILLREYGNYCEIAYEKARMRCGKEK